MPTPSLLLFVGTYTRGGSRGLYRLRLDPSTGALSAPEVAAETGNPTYLAFSPDKRFLYALRDSEAMAVAFAVTDPEGALSPLPASPAAAAAAPCYLTVDQTRQTLLVAHYHTAVVAALPIHADGSLGEPRRIHHVGRSIVPNRQDSAHVHSARISPDNRFAVVCDLGQDKLFTYRLDAAQSTLTPAEPPFLAVTPGSGPRHSVFSADGSRLYVSNELASTVSTFAYEAATGRLAHRQTLSTLPDGLAGKIGAAEILLHPDGRHLYVSNRGDNSLARFTIDPASGELALGDFTPCGGQGPRGVGLSSDGRWLVCGHQESGTVCSFAIGAEGRLRRIEGSVAVPFAAAVLFRD